MSIDSLAPSIQAAAEAEDQFARAVAARAAMVRSGEMSLDGIASMYQDAVRKALQGHQGPNPRQFFSKQKCEQMQFFRDLGASGHVFHRASQADHDYLFTTILSTVDAGVKPAVRTLLQQYGESQGYSAEWAGKVAIKTQPKKMAKSLAKHANHPVIQDLKEVGMLTQTHKSHLKNSTYSGLAEGLFSGSHLARRMQKMEAEMAAVKARLSQVEAAAAVAHAKLDLKEAGLDWKEKARAVLAAEPGISKRELARRVGKTHTAVGKYIAELTECADAAQAA